MANKQPYQLTARTLALTDIIPTQAADGSTEVGKNTIQDVADLVSGVVTVKVSLSSAEILALNATPKTLVAAPGSGKMIRGLSVVMKLNYGTTTYATNVLAQVRHASTTANLVTTTIIGSTENTITEQLCSTSLSYATATSNPVNKAVEITIGTGNPTTGDGTLDVYFSYIVITL